MSPRFIVTVLIALPAFAALACGSDGAAPGDIADGTSCAPCATAPDGTCDCGAGPCQNGALDDGEEGVDCGGSCAPCASLAACDDGLPNGDETDVDCGGSCDPCAVGRGCVERPDCASGLCADGVCATPPETCDDGVLDGDESDIDCGGSCPPCTSGHLCQALGDCVSGVCAAGLCAAASCEDGVANGDESDVDCGGSDCELCATGLACREVGDCATGDCDDGTCVDCSDGARNGSETDVDCGGDLCLACADGGACVEGDDCGSGSCDQGGCVSCEDGVRNGDESGVDCGGERCAPCGAGASCTEDEECAHGLCEAGVCEAPRASWISAGARHACAVVQRGRVLCWGADDDAQSGAAILDAPGATRPVLLDTWEHLEGVERVYAGPRHTCAVTPTDVYCWGTFRHVGGSRSGTATRILRGSSNGNTSAITNVDAMALGLGHTCLLRGHEVSCWGANDYDQLGNASAAGLDLPIDGTEAVVFGAQAELVAGDDHTCVRTTNGVACWGYNLYGQCGQGSAESLDDPYTIPGFTVSTLAASYDGSCAVKDGVVSCWGARPYALDAGLPSHVPLSFQGWSGVTRVALGRDFACAQTSDGVSCVGATSTALGTNPNTATTVAGLDGEVAQLVAGWAFACARTTDGAVRCWGANGEGQLGDGTTTSRAAAAPWVP